MEPVVNAVNDGLDKSLDKSIELFATIANASQGRKDSDNASQSMSSNSEQSQNLKMGSSPSPSSPAVGEMAPAAAPEAASALGPLALAL